MIPISVCIITKNESEALEKCLTALKKYPYEIIVADTGSTDDSKEVARKYADKVLDFTWCDDFSAARNFVVSKASHNMILSLDTDEVVTDIDLDAVDRLIEDNPTSIGMIELLNYFEVNGGKRAQVSRNDRLFNRKYYTFSDRIHEHLVPIGKTIYSTYEAPITADHFGYLGETDKLQAKALRDIQLLEKALEQSSNSASPYYYFQIAQSYLVMRDHENALVYFQMAMDRNPNPNDSYASTLIVNYGNMLLHFGRNREALSLLSYYDYYQDNADYLCLIGVTYFQLDQPLKALPEFIKAFTAPKYDSLDSRSVLPSFYIGCIYESFGQFDIAKSHYQKCGEYPLAMERLKHLS